MRNVLGLLLGATVVADGLILLILIWGFLSAQIRMTGGEWVLLLIVASGGTLAGREFRALWRYQQTGALAWIAIFGGLVLPLFALFIAAATCCALI